VSCQLLSLQLGFVPHLSGRDNAILSGLMLGMRRRDIVARLPSIREFCELGDFFEQPIASYSSGMVMRLAFSVAIQIEPDVLLIDEVLAVGDAEFQEKSGDALRQRMGEGHTVVLVSHQERQISALCDRVLWVEHGKSVLEGERDAVFEAYHREIHLQGTPP
jgi:lipopolysaccharide transport system ATP-binding protein